MKKHLTLFVCVFTSVLLAIGCGNSNEAASKSSAEAPAAYDAGAEMKRGVYESSAADYDYEEAAAEEAMVMEDETGAGYSADETSSAGSNENAAENADPLKGRKLITTMNVSAETQTFDETLADIEAKTASLGGYIESSDIRNGNSYYDIYYGSSSSSRHANLTVRIPAPKLGDFIDMVEEKSNILSQSRSVEDITLSYVDTESRKNALKAEEKRLLKFMEEAENVEEMLAVEERLTDVRYELERTESQLRTFDNQINFSTVYLDINEVSVYSEPKPEQTVWERISEGFADNLENVEEWLVDLFVWIVVHSPQILIFLVFAFIIGFVVVTLDRKSRKNSIKRYELRKAQEAKALAEAKARAEAVSQAEKELPTSPEKREGTDTAGPEDR